MNSSIETGKPKVGYIGDQAAAVTEEWGKVAEVSRLAEGQHPGGLDMVLIDCQSADGSSVGAERLAELLQSGVRLAVANPTADVLQRLQAIAGVAPDESVALAVYSRVPGSDPPAYHLTTVPVARQSDIVGVSAPDDDAQAGALRAAAAPIPDEASETKPVAVDWGSAFSLAQESDGGERRKPLLTAGVGGPAGSLFPPAGAYFGNKTSSYPFSAELGSPNCDRRCTQFYNYPKQIINGRLDNEYYVYWADGDSNPYYVLIHKQTGSINPAVSGRSPRRTLTWEGQSKGWMMTQLDFQYFTLGLPAGASARLLARGPQENIQDGVGFQFQIPMRLRTMQAGARMPYDFTADSGSQFFRFVGWAVKDNTDPVAGKTAWTFSQAAAWTRATTPWDKFGEWWRNMYYDNDWVKYAEDVGRSFFPEQSSNIFNYTVMNAWRIDCPYPSQAGSKPVPPPALSVRLDHKLIVDMSMFHNCDGCLQGHHHLFMFWNDWSGGDQLQLDQIVRIN